MYCCLLADEQKYILASAEVVFSGQEWNKIVYGWRSVPNPAPIARPRSRPHRRSSSLQSWILIDATASGRKEKGGWKGEEERGWRQGRFYVGAGGTCPHIHLLPPDSKASWKNVGLYGVRIFFRFRRTDKMDSVMKELTGQYPQNFWARTAPVGDEMHCILCCITVTSWVVNQLTAMTLAIYRCRCDMFLCLAVSSSAHSAVYSWQSLSLCSATDWLSIAARLDYTRHA